jgi:hypothetical protein
MLAEVNSAPSSPAHRIAGTSRVLVRLVLLASGDEVLREGMCIVDARV